MLMDVLSLHSEHVFIIVHYFILKAMDFHDITHCDRSVLAQEIFLIYRYNRIQLCIDISCDICKQLIKMLLSL